MQDGMFIFDNAIHVYDLSDDNLLLARDDSRPARDHLAGLAAALGWAGVTKTAVDLSVRWSVDRVYDLVFTQSPTDMAMAQVVPLFDWYQDGFAPIELQHQMAVQYPDQVLFCGGVDPLYRGVADALASIDYQVQELGAVSMKFYNGHPDGGWRCDDADLAYPLYERCRRNGIRVLQFHKGFPFGLMNVEQLSPIDLQKAARDHPDMIFLVHHLGLPYFDEMVSIASRFSNIYLSLASNISAVLLQPRLVQKQIGRLLMEVGSEKLIWGSDAALLGPPRPYLEAFASMTIPDDLRDGYGYPQLTDEDKARILGLNFAKLMGVDVEAKMHQLYAAAKVPRS